MSPTDHNKSKFHEEKRDWAKYRWEFMRRSPEYRNAKPESAIRNVGHIHKSYQELING